MAFEHCTEQQFKVHFTPVPTKAIYIYQNSIINALSASFLHYVQIAVMSANCAEKSYDLLFSSSICTHFPSVGLEWLYASNQHFTTVTHRSLQLPLYRNVQQGGIFIHTLHMFTCTCTTCMPWHNTKLHNTVIIMVNTKVKSANIQWF